MKNLVTFITATAIVFIAFLFAVQANSTLQAFVSDLMYWFGDSNVIISMIAVSAVWVCIVYTAWDIIDNIVRDIVKVFMNVLRKVA